MKKRDSRPFGRLFFCNGVENAWLIQQDFDGEKDNFMVLRGAFLRWNLA